MMGLYLANRLDRLRRHDNHVVSVRGKGMLWAVELRDAAVANQLVRSALKDGVILLQSGLEGNVITISPPVVITEKQILRALDLVERSLVRVAA
jgi:4-aminobutyrate aminotransferase-like enzyme